MHTGHPPGAKAILGPADTAVSREVEILVLMNQTIHEMDGLARWLQIRDKDEAGERRWGSCGVEDAGAISLRK